jgi:hypothetical protein
MQVGNAMATHSCTCAQVLVVAGGVSVGAKLRGVVAQAQRKQKALCAEVLAARSSGSAARKHASARVAVNRLFFKRLLAILRM